MSMNETQTVRASSPSNLTTSPGESHSHIEKIALVGLLSVVIVVVIVGNTLVILAVITTRRLRTVTNCFVMSLAVADWLVGVFVMPPAVAYQLMGVWKLGWILCDIWVSLDILLCTASILSLCAISVDRYLAVTRPLTYSRKTRSKRLAFAMILVVWLSSALITCPPMFGWYNTDQKESENCGYNKDPGYVIFSAMGSFFIPMVVMLYVYVRISCVVAQRHDQLTNIDNHSRNIDRVSSEYDEPNLRYPRYIRQITACGQSMEPLSQNNHDQRQSSLGTRSLRSNLNYSFNIDPALTPQRAPSFYRTHFPSQRSRPELSFHLEPSLLNCGREPGRVSSFRRETKTAQTLSIVMGGFIACWLPFFIFYLLTPFISTNDVNDTIMSYLTWLGWFNSAINPFIYAFYSRDFRIAFWRLTVKHFSKTRRPSCQHK